MIKYVGSNIPQELNFKCVDMCSIYGDHSIMLSDVITIIQQNTYVKNGAE